MSVSHVIQAGEYRKLRLDNLASQESRIVSNVTSNNEGCVVFLESGYKKLRVDLLNTREDNNLLYYY